MNYPLPPRPLEILCPQCQSGNITIVPETDTCHCTDCDNYFPLPDPVKVAAATARHAALMSQTSPQNSAVNSASKIRELAGLFTVLSVLCVVLGILIGIEALCYPASSTVSGLISAACFGLALWLFLVAQIIHIRANTER